MPWKENLVMDQKKEFVLESLKSYVNFTKLCAKYCISTKTGYKWKQRFLQNGFTGLNELSKCPKSNPFKLTEEIILEIIKIKIKKKNWGSRKIREIYSNNHPEESVPARSNFDRILKKAGLIKPRKKKKQ